MIQIKNKLLGITALLVSVSSLISTVGVSLPQTNYSSVQSVKKMVGSRLLFNGNQLKLGDLLENIKGLVSCSNNTASFFVSKDQTKIIVVSSNSVKSIPIPKGKILGSINIIKANNKYLFVLSNYQNLNRLYFINLTTDVISEIKNITTEDNSDLLQTAYSNETPPYLIAKIFVSKFNDNLFSLALYVESNNNNVPESKRAAVTLGEITSSNSKGAQYKFERYYTYQLSKTVMKSFDYDAMYASEMRTLKIEYSPTDSIYIVGSTITSIFDFGGITYFEKDINKFVQISKVFNYKKVNKSLGLYGISISFINGKVYIGTLGNGVFYNNPGSRDSFVQNGTEDTFTTESRLYHIFSFNGSYYGFDIPPVTSGGPLGFYGFYKLNLKTNVFSKSISPPFIQNDQDHVVSIADNGYTPGLYVMYRSKDVLFSWSTKIYYKIDNKLETLNVSPDSHFITSSNSGFITTDSSTDLNIFKIMNTTPLVPINPINTGNNKLSETNKIIIGVVVGVGAPLLLTGAGLGTYFYFKKSKTIKTNTKKK